jgi:hypothetical protein
MFLRKSIFLDALRRKKSFGEWTPSGLRYIPKLKGRHLGGTKHDDKRQQTELIGHVIDEGYTMQVCIFNARQRNEAERDRYRHRLGFWLKNQKWPYLSFKK